jgi:Protein of unknown function (DUF2510)
VTPDNPSTWFWKPAEPVRRAARPERSATLRRAAAGAALAVSLVALSVAGTLLLGTGIAAAAGNASLDKLILKDPEPGWQALTAAEAQEFETSITNELASSSGSSNNFATAVEGWQSPAGASTATLAIFIVQALNGSVGSSAASQATDFCTGATNNTPTSAPAIPNVPDSAVTSCSGNGENVTVGTAITGTYLEFVASFGSSPLSTTEVAPVVSDQLSAIEAATTTTTTSGSGSSGSSSPGATTATSSSSSVPIIAGAAGGVVVIAAIVAFVLLRRRKPSVALAAHGPHTGAPSGGPHLGRSDHGDSGPYGHVPSPVTSPGAAPPPAPAGAPTHDPWDDSDPGWLSSHQAAGAGAASVPATPSAPAGPPGAPGWYEDPDDKASMRYWDGTSYTGRRRWDGSNWVDA